MNTPNFDVTTYQDTDVIRRALMGYPGGSMNPRHRHGKTVALVGLSANELRASNFVGRYLLRHGYEVFPVNPKEQQILGREAYASLSDLPVPVSVVDVFRAPSAVPGIAEEAVAIGAGCLWLQYGIFTEEGNRIALEGGMDLVVDRCMKVEHARYFGRMHWLGMNTGQISAQRAGAV